MDTTAIGISPLRLPSVSFNLAGAAFISIRSTLRQVQRRVELGHILPAPGKMCSTQKESSLLCRAVDSIPQFGECPVQCLAGCKCPLGKSELV